jgi:hypothetical protein
MEKTSSAEELPFPVLHPERDLISNNLRNLFSEFTERALSLERAESMVGFSRTTFWRFRKRHRIQLLTGRRICVADIIAGFEAERNGQRRTIR